MSVSKNNFTNKMEQNAHRVPHYGIRKLSVGVASVLLGTTLYFGGVAHADVINGNDSNTANPQPQEEQEVNKDSAVTQNAQNVQKKTVALSQGHQKEVGGGILNFAK